MKKQFFILTILSIFLFSACSNGLITSGKLNVVTTFYPLYEIASKIGNEKIFVKTIVPNGIEPHDYEPTPQDIISLNKADLVIYNGAGFEPWINKILPELQENGVEIINYEDVFRFSILKAEEEESIYDPHFWLDPLNFRDMVYTVTDKFVGLDPENEKYYRDNMEAYSKELIPLQQDFEKGLANCKYRSIVASHAAFAYLAKRYNLEMISVSGISPEISPSAKTLADISKIIEEKGIKYIFTETLIDSKVVETLAEETGAMVLVLNPIEGLTEEELQTGENYVTIMRKNLENLKTALECT